MTNHLLDGDPNGPISVELERRGRAWLLWAFLFCPCHLPLTLGVLVALAGGTALGGVLREHAFAAGAIVTITWLAGTGYGLSLIRRADRARGACPAPSVGSGDGRDDSQGGH